MSPQHESHNLDLLRGIAVVMVLVCHLLLYFGVTSIGPYDVRWWGFGAILFFFVHTSLVLMMSLERLQARLGGAKLYFGFMLRRCFRIYPLSVVVVLAIYLFHLPLGKLMTRQLEWVGVSKLGLLWNVLLVQNLLNTSSILGPLWSLPVEIQMYVFLPFLFLVARHTRTVWPLLGLWALSVVGGIAYLRLGHGPDLLRFVPCFLPGVIAYKVLLQPHRPWPSYVWPVLLGGLALIFPFAGPSEKGWVICLVLGLTVTRFAEVSNRWVNQLAHWFSKYSYGFYLTHYFCMWLAFVKLGWLPLAAQWAVLIASVVGLPVLVYYVVEQPLIRMGSQCSERLLERRAMPSLVTASVATPDARAYPVRAPAALVQQVISQDAP